MAPGIDDHPQLKASGRKTARGFHQDNFSEPKSSFLRIAQPGAGPSMINRHEEGHLIGHCEGFPQKRADLAPRWICNDPIYPTLPCQEITALFYLTPSCIRWQNLQKRPVSTARLKDRTLRRQSGDQGCSQGRRGLDVIIADIITIRLITHTQSQTRRNETVQAKKRPGPSFEEPGQRPGNNLLSRDLTSYYHWLLGA
jgi:hypothetical protein